MDREARLDFLRDHIPDLEDFFPLLSDFRFGGYKADGKRDRTWKGRFTISFDACFGRNFSRKWLNALPESVIVRGRDKGRGVCRYKAEKIMC